MTYALIKDSQVLIYPYSLEQFRLDNTFVSLPTAPTKEQLEEVNLFEVFNSDIPNINKKTERVVAGPLQFIDTVWKTSWIIENLSQEEIDNNISLKWNEVRQQRDQLLTNCDWTQLSDVVLDNKQEWAEYRQQLRDITNQPDPYAIVWPNDPNYVESEVDTEAA